MCLCTALPISGCDPSGVIVAERLRIWLQKTRPSILMLWAHDGGMGQKDAEESKNALFCRALRFRQQSEILASHPGLLSPPETNLPASLAMNWQMAELAN